MRRRSGIWIIAGVMVTGLLFLLAQSVIFSDETELLSKSEAEDRLADQVDGDFVFRSESATDFTFEITRDQGVYHATVSREDGSIIDLTREATIEHDEETTNDSDEENSSNQGSNQTEQNDDENNSESNKGQDSTQNDEDHPNNDNENDTEDEPTHLSADEVTNQINQEYEGEITSIELDDDSDIYTLVIEHELTRTELEVDALTGEIIARETEDTTPELAVTEEEATTIALEQVQGDGEVTNVQLQEINGIIYYIVTINVTKEEQATVEINGFSGDVETVTWAERNDNSTEEENENNQNVEEEESD